MDPNTKKTATFTLSDWAFIEGALVAVEAIEGPRVPVEAGRSKMICKGSWEEEHSI